jgi:predicted Zn-dependent peptidase
LDKRISRLERQLNRNNLDVAVSYEFTNNIEANALVIKISADKRIDLEKAKYILNKELSACISKLVSGADMKMVKELMEIDLKKNMQDLKSRSFLLAHYYHLALYDGIDFSRGYLNRLRKITTHDIHRVSRSYLKKENLVVLNVYRKEYIGKNK